MVVPEVEGLRAKLEIHPFGDSNVFEEREILIVIAESAIVCDARAAPVISRRSEVVHRLERRGVKERFARVEIALTLRPRTFARQHAGDAGEGELLRDVAFARTEGEGSSRTEA